MRLLEPKGNFQVLPLSDFVFERNFPASHIHPKSPNLKPLREIMSEGEKEKSE